MYELENLVEKFQEHHEKWEKQNQELIEDFKLNNPSEEIPEVLIPSISLPLALKAICEEIIELKKAGNEDLNP